MSAVRGRRCPKTDDRVTFAPPLCCRKPLTNKGHAVVKGARRGRFRAYEAFHFHCRNSRCLPVRCRCACQCAGQRHAGAQQSFARRRLHRCRHLRLSAAANLTRDLNFNGTISGNVYAQPLYIEGGPNGPMIIAVTESNNVYALDATTGLPIWSRTDIGPPVPTTPCGGFNPTGITGTPVVDLASRSTFLRRIDQRQPDKHFIYSLNVDTGATTAGLAGGRERHRHLQRHPLCFLGAGRTRWTGSGERDRVRVLLRLRGRLRQLSWLGCRR